MGKYVDGFVLVVPKNKIEEYKKMAKEGAQMWKKYGALEYFECMGDDLTPKSFDGEKPLAFPVMAKAKADETVWFSFVVYKSKKHRDEVNAKVINEMNKEKEKYKDVKMPFETNRMAYGGFGVAAEA